MLIRHKRTHGKERPFSCAHCNRVFLSKSELRRHLVVHSGMLLFHLVSNFIAVLLHQSCKSCSFFLDEKPFSCKYCQMQFRRKDNLNRHIRHHHMEDSSSGVETKTKRPPMVVVEAAQSCPVKNNRQSRQKQQKSRRTQPKSPGKVVASSRHDQINSRLDSMGNIITPVIKTTGEVSNAVPVINGPINIRRLEERSDRKMFTYTEPIPIAEAAVLNCRIEEKLYPQSASSHYFVHNYLKDKNAKINSYSSNSGKFAPKESSNSVVAAFSQTDSPLSRTTDWKNAVICEEKSYQAKDETRRDDEKSQKINRNLDESKKDSNDASPGDERSNYVSTIKKHTIEQSNGDSSENSTNDSKSSGTMNHVTLPKNFQDKKKQSDACVHWRRRIAEILGPIKRHDS